MAKKSSSSSPSLLVLPEELLFEVLFKLPVESLIILCSVCKLLKTCISSKYFCRSHVQRWVNRDAKTKNVFLRHDFAPDDDDDDPASRGKKLCLEFAKSAIDFEKPRNCRFLFEENSLKLQFGGCYDGILCFYEFRGLSDTDESQDLEIYICNPALNECRVVSRRRNLIYCKNMTKVCFVPDPDPASDDYRVIVVSGSKVYVFSLNNCCWRQIDTSSAGTGPEPWNEGFPQMSDLVVHNESVYWLSNYAEYDDIDDYNVLNVLDLHRESVREIALPRFLRRKIFTCGDFSFSLLRHQGCLAIWESDYTNSYKAKLSVMQEEGDVISWGKPIKIDFRDSCRRLGREYRLACKYSSAKTSSNWVYLMSSKKETSYVMISSLESAQESLGKFRIPYLENDYDYIAADYVPSLVSVMPEEH